MYYESAEDVRISLSRVWKELDRHGSVGMDRLYIVAMIEQGEDGLYDAQELLRWLGY